MSIAAFQIVGNGVILNIHEEVNQDTNCGTSLVVQWLRIHLPMQRTRVQSLVWEVSTCHRAAKPVCHKQWSLCTLEPVLSNKRSQGFPGGTSGNAGDIRDVGSIPGPGRNPGQGNGNLLQYSGLENPMDRGAQHAAVHRVTKSQTQLKQLSAHTHTHTHPTDSSPSLYNWIKSPCSNKDSM